MKKWDDRFILSRHPEDLFSLIDDKLEDWIDWEVETFLSELSEHVGQMAVDKLLAVKSVAYNTNLAVSNAAPFEKIVNAFNNQVCLMDALQPSEIEDIFYAVVQIEKIAKKVHKSVNVAYHSQIPGYVAACARMSDWVVLPKPLAFAQDMLDNLTGISYRCIKDENIKTTIDALKKLSVQLDSVHDITPDSLKRMLDGLDTDRHEYRDASRLIGCYLYRPSEVA